MRSRGAWCAMPALETTTSSPPYASTAATTASSTDASEVTSIATPTARPAPASFPTPPALLVFLHDPPAAPLGAGGVDARPHDVRALAGEPAGDRPADAADGAGH